ncbi:MAG: DUF4232 domain-containing protein [Actinobacteria bacterium]|nr:MAG: DUF4232 domain-containing protein [Actinomycetota bacterium]
MEKIRTSLIGVTVAAIVALAAFPTISAALQTASRPASCLRNQLGVRANGINGAAGTIHGAWVFTNVSTTACDLDGYPDIQLYGRAGRPIPTTVKRNLPPAPSHVKLLPGGSATFYSSYNDVPSGSAACPTSAVIQITPPNASASLFIPAQLQACRGVVHVSAVRAGVHPA